MSTKHLSQYTLKELKAEADVLNSNRVSIDYRIGQFFMYGDSADKAFENLLKERDLNYDRLMNIHRQIMYLLRLSIRVNEAGANN